MLVRRMPRGSPGTKVTGANLRTRPLSYSLRTHYTMTTSHMAGLQCRRNYVFAPLSGKSLMGREPERKGSTLDILLKQTPSTMDGSKLYAL